MFLKLHLKVFSPEKRLQVSSSRKEILISSNLPKTELKNVNFCPSLTAQKFFVRFLGALREKALSKLTDLLLQGFQNKANNKGSKLELEFDQIPSYYRRSEAIGTFMVLKFSLTG